MFQPEGRGKEERNTKQLSFKDINWKEQRLSFHIQLTALAQRGARKQSLTEQSHVQQKFKRFYYQKKKEKNEYWGQL